MTASVLDQLRTMTTVVADTGELDAVRLHQPQDCTTNPSLVLKAFDTASSKAVLEAEIASGLAAGQSLDQIAATLPIALGAELSRRGAFRRKLRRICPLTPRPL